MASILEKLWANMASYPSELSAEIRDRERFKDQLQAVFTNQPTGFSGLDTILTCERDRRSAVAHSRKMTLQVVFNIHFSNCYMFLALLVGRISQNLTETVTRITK